MTTFRRITDALRSALSKRAGLLRVLALVGSAILMTAATPNAAEACGITDPASCVALIFIKIFQLLTALMGWILVLEVDALIRVSQFHNFVSPGPSAVQIGWIVTRDLANMFFIVVLLIIAFGTILGSSTYHYEKNLPRLLIMAVVINFSKTICGIFIDMGQVLMLTFVNGFKEAAGGNFVNAFQVNKLLALAETGGGSYTFGMVIAMMFAFILTAIAASVVLVMLVIMIFRIVMLWVLIILSPIAFLTSAVPKGGDYYAQWWKEFKKYIVTGPVIAFFLWLALASVQHAGSGGLAGPNQGLPGSSTASTGEATAAGKIGDSQIPTEAGATSDVIMNMIIAICLMFAGLKFASESGAVGLGAAKSIRNAATKAARGAATYGAKRAAQPFLTGGGKLLAKVPLVGGLGRAAVLKGESWKKDRQSAREKFAGTPEDMARLSPGAYARKVGGLKDSGEIARFMKAGSSNPAAMAALTATKESFNPLTGERTKKSAGKDAIMNMIADGDGAGAAKLLTSDKRFADMAKADPELLTNTYQGLLDAAKADPGLGKDVGAFEQKFAAQIQKNSPGMLDDKLKTLVPKMSNEDLAGLDEGGVSMMLDHFNPGQLKQIMQGGRPDQLKGAAERISKMPPEGAQRFFADKNVSAGDIPASWYGDANVADFVLEKTKGDPKARAEAMGKGGKALSERADQRYRDATTKEQILAALPDAITVGTLDAGKINSDAGLQSFVKDNAGQIDLAALSRNISVSDKGRSDAGKALTTLIGDVNHDKISNLRKGGMSEHILASSADTQARATQAKDAKRDTYVNEAMSGALTAAIAGQVSQLRGVGADAQADALSKSFEKVKASMDQLKETQTSLAEAQAKLASSTGMNAGQMDALKSAAEGLKKRVDDLKTSVAQSAAEVKGEKFDAGGNSRRGGGGRRP